MSNGSSMKLVIRNLKGQLLAKPTLSIDLSSMYSNIFYRIKLLFKHRVTFKNTSNKSQCRSQ